MQNLNLNGNQYWNNGASFNQNMAGPQMNMNMNMNNMQYYNQLMSMQGDPNMSGGFNNYSFPLQNSFETMQNFNFQTPTEIPEVNEQPVKEPEEEKEVPIPMRLPGHMKKVHFRSHSMTPVESNENKEIKRDLMHDKFSSIQKPKAMRLEKLSSEKYNKNFTPQLKNRVLDSNKSLPALKSLSEFCSSVKSDSSFFD